MSDPEPPAERRDDPHTWSDPKDPDQDQATWADPDSKSPATGKVISTREWMQIEAERDTRRHHMRMQVWILSGVGLTFIGTVLILVISLGLGWIPPAFGTELMRMVIPTVLGAGLTIVGTFFRDSGRGNKAP